MMRCKRYYGQILIVLCSVFLLASCQNNDDEQTRHSSKKNNVSNFQSAEDSESEDGVDEEGRDMDRYNVLYIDDTRVELPIAECDFDFPNLFLGKLDEDNEAYDFVRTLSNEEHAIIGYAYVDEGMIKGILVTNQFTTVSCEIVGGISLQSSVNDVYHEWGMQNIYPEDYLGDEYCLPVSMDKIEYMVCRFGNWSDTQLKYDGDIYVESYGENYNPNCIKIGINEADKVERILVWCSRNSNCDENIEYPVEYNLLKNPQKDIITHEEYMSLGNRSNFEISVKGFVQAYQLLSDDGVKEYAIYFQDDDGGYEARYTCSADENLSLSPGDKIKVTGYIDFFIKKHIDCTKLEKEEGFLYLANSFDVSDMLGTEDIKAKQNMYVCVEGLTVEELDGRTIIFEDIDNESYSFDASKDNQIVHLKIESDVEAINQGINSNIQELKSGDKINVTGILQVHTNAIYILVLSIEKVS